MFENFTDRARKVLALARKEASDVNSRVIDEQHLLVGLLKESSGVAHYVLEEAALSAKILRDGILGYKAADKKLGEEDQREIVAEKLPYSPSAISSFLDAIAEARKLKHNYVGTEHILLGLLQSNYIRNVLNYMKVNPTELKEHIMDLINAKPLDEVMKEYEALKQEKGKWEMCGSYNHSHAPLRYDELEIWILKDYGFILNNLVSKSIVSAETYFLRIEIDYNNRSEMTKDDTILAIRVYKKKL
jgi:ATP-dependent Clp protease ATP-binding subunit ClpC